MVIIPPPTSANWWKIGLASGRIVTVAPDVIPCSPPAARPGNTSKQTNPDYALIDGQVVKAPGLVGQLSTLTSKQGYVKALVASPSKVSPGASIRVTGYGWVGPEATLTVGWSIVGKPGIQERQLAKVPVRQGGEIEWVGRLPADLPASATDLSLFGDDGVRSNAVQLQVQ